MRPPERAPDADRKLNRVLIYILLLLNSAVLIFLCGMILWLILAGCEAGRYCIGIASLLPHLFGTRGDAGDSLLVVLGAAGCLLLAMVALGHLVTASKISHRSMWSHPHFSAATLAQFFYVAAQAGIFSFLINYMTSEVPPLPALVELANSPRAWSKSTPAGSSRSATRGLPSSRPSVSSAS